MPTNIFSRRNFLTVLTTSCAVVATGAPDLSPLISPSGTQTYLHRPSDQPIRIVCTAHLTDAEIAQIKSMAKNIDLHIAGDSVDSAPVEEAEVILGWVDAATIKRAKKCKWVQLWAAGVENIPKELIDHSCTLTNMQRTFAPVIAESAIGLLLSLTRGLAQVSIPAFREKKWTQAPDSVFLDDLYGKTIGIVGMGGIGSETARRLHYGFNMRVLATDAKPLPKPEFVHELHDPSWLLEMVPQVDVLMSAAPLTKETKGIFNEDVFRKMKPTAYFINVSRGGLVDQPSLIRALKERRIRGAGLDVATPEPLPPDSALWTCPNLVISPHNSTNAPSRLVRLIGLVAENVRRYSHGLPLLNLVDKEKGY